jgi:cysteine-rich repeat protein
VWTFELYICGDGIIDPGEQCDDDGESVACDVDCTFPACGDGTLNASTGEGCDDGNTTSSDCCDATCSLEPAGSPCLDSTVCNGDEACDGNGTCVPGTPLDCTDGDPCSHDTCDPALGCNSEDAPSCAAQAGTDGKIKIRVNAAGETELRWSKKRSLPPPFWMPGNAPSALCIWDTHGGTYDRVFEAFLPPAPSSWTGKANNLYYTRMTFRDPLGLHDGLTRISAVKKDFPLKTRFLLVLEGPNAPAPPSFSLERMFDQSSTVYVQYREDGNYCAGSYFEVDDTARNRADLFNAKRK